MMVVVYKPSVVARSEAAFIHLPTSMTNQIGLIVVNQFE